MSDSFLNILILSFDNKWNEIELLIEKAKKYQSLDESFYNAICRSITVLLTAHLEGFVKILVKSVIDDLNSYSVFEDIPLPIKRTYCKKYLGSNPDNTDKNFQNKIDKLIAKFSELGSKITSDPFFYSNNKNPNASIIKTVFSNFGVENIFSYFSGSKIDNAFEGNHSGIIEIITEFKAHIENNTKFFPYSVDIAQFGFKKRKKSNEIWETFLENINQSRHKVAHGNEFNNVADITELEMNKDKITAIPAEG